MASLFSLGQSRTGQGDSALPRILYSLRKAGSGNIGIPVMVLVLLGMMTLPMPAFLLDVFFSFNIALSIVVLLVAVYTLRPLDFAVFPTILLVATLLRLALNVASTRVVLLEGHSGGDAAGKVIQAFGEVVIGGNYAVGLVVFIILIIINFVVVTKGAGRISEVSARFTLDAMPGKQMAIDADLNAGLIDQDQARARRAEVSAEADFYGAMDGASKFVRGDAIAGILILVINVIGGLTVGMAQHELGFDDAMQKYILLTIGDGLVAQIPSLMLSTSAAILVTRVNSAEELRNQIFKQMFDSPKALSVAATILFIMGAIPGMPHVAFLGLAVVSAALAYFIARKNMQPEVIEEEGPKRRFTSPKTGASPPGGVQSGPAAIETQTAPRNEEIKDIGWDDVAPVDIIGLEVGYRLIPMVDKNQGGELLGRIKGVRKKLSQLNGFLIPSVHIRDNLDLLPNAYRITLMGVTLGEAEVHPDRDMAINPGQVFGNLEGIETTDPAFGLKAIWIDSGNKERAQTLGYTVVDASTVIATHLNQILQKHSHELIGHEDVQHLVDQLEKSSPKLVEELIPNYVTLNTLLKVLQQLLREQVSIRDMRSIAEALAAHSNKNQDVTVLTAAARLALSRQIVQFIVGSDEEIPVITLKPELEHLLLQCHQQAQNAGADESAFLEPGLAQKIRDALAKAAQKQEVSGKPVVLLVTSNLRPMMSRFTRTVVPDAHVLSYNEIPDNKRLSIDASIGT